jgi:hypothetical protein
MIIDESGSFKSKTGYWRKLTTGSITNKYTTIVIITVKISTIGTSTFGIILGKSVEIHKSDNYSNKWL